MDIRESWLMKKADKKKTDSFIWNMVLEAGSKDTWNTRKIDKCVPEQNKPENIARDENDKTEAVPLQAHHEKAETLGKTIMLRKATGKEDWVRDGPTP